MRYEYFLLAHSGSVVRYGFSETGQLVSHDMLFGRGEWCGVQYGTSHANWPEAAFKNYLNSKKNEPPSFHSYGELFEYALGWLENTWKVEVHYKEEIQQMLLGAL